MKAYFVHHMMTGLGEIFSSWLSIFYINNILKEKGFKTYLAIECTESCGYFSVDTIFDFFDKSYISSKFNTIEVNKAIHINNLNLYTKTPQLDNPMYSIYSTETTLPVEIEDYLNLSAKRVYGKNLSLNLPPLVRSDIDLFTPINEDFSIHHIRVVDQMESITISKLAYDKVKPNLKEQDYILSNSRTVLNYIQSKSNLNLNFLNRDNIVNHPYTNMPNVDVKTKTDSLLQAYREMCIGSNAKKLYSYSAWDTVSGFLILSAIKQIPFVHHHIKEILNT